jgi:sugar phosphate isomerase/epimerase
MVTHMGFLPENPNTDEFRSVVEAIKELALYCKENGQYLLFETGQETPITLKRTIMAVNTGNLGINLDPANLLLYGKANPCDAVDIFGDYVRGVHGKDGEYPTNPDYLGEEKRIGDGRANFPVLIKKLKEHGYDGSITIEREISGDKQIEDIIYAKKFLEDIING